MAGERSQAQINGQVKRTRTLAARKKKETAKQTKAKPKKKPHRANPSPIQEAEENDEEENEEEEEEPEHSGADAMEVDEGDNPLLRGLKGIERIQAMAAIEDMESKKAARLQAQEKHDAEMRKLNEAQVRASSLLLIARFSSPIRRCPRST